MSADDFTRDFRSEVERLTRERDTARAALEQRGGSGTDASVVDLGDAGLRERLTNVMNGWERVSEGSLPIIVTEILAALRDKGQGR